MNTDLALLFVIVVVAFWAWIIYRLNIGRQMAKERERLLAEAQKKEPSDWTEEDRKLLLADLEKHRHFYTFQQYDILQAKYTGTTSVTEMMIKSGYSPSEINKMSTHNTIKSQATSQGDATKTIVKDAIIGGVIAGEAGAVVGAIVGKSKIDNDRSNSK